MSFVFRPATLLAIGALSVGLFYATIVVIGTGIFRFCGCPVDFFLIGLVVAAGSAGVLGVLRIWHSHAAAGDLRTLALSLLIGAIWAGATFWGAEELFRLRLAEWAVFVPLALSALVVSGVLHGGRRTSPRSFVSDTVFTLLFSSFVSFAAFYVSFALLVE